MEGTESKKTEVWQRKKDRPGKGMMGMDRQVMSSPSSGPFLNHGEPDNLVDHPSDLEVLQLNARSAQNKASLSQDLIPVNRLT